MMNSNDDRQALDRLFGKDGEGSLLACYEAGRDKPHAESSYRLLPMHPGLQSRTHTFISTLHARLEQAARSPFIPDTRIELYTFPRMADVPPMPEGMNVREYINGRLLPYIKDTGLKPEASVNLRDMAFARSEGLSVEPGGTLRLGAGQIDRLAEFRRRQDGLAARYGYTPEYALPLRVVTTSGGMFVFSGNAAGMKGLHALYQHLADNYFSPHGEPGPVRQYNVPYLPDKLLPLIDAACRKDPATGRHSYDFTAPAPAERLSRKGWELMFATDMEPSAEGYRLLAGFGQCRTEGDNADICRLLTLQWRFDRDAILDPAFAYRHQFKDYVRRMDECANGLSSGDSMGQVLDEVRARAGAILRTDFDVRGHRRPERIREDRRQPRTVKGKKKSNGLKP